ncbi:MAG: M60 family metallopeptidase [Opitutaceae bacterium]
MKALYNLLIVFTAGLLLSGATSWAGANRDALFERATAILDRSEALGTDLALVEEAFDLAQTFEQSEGALFISKETRKGFPRKPNGDLELERAMFSVFQSILDFAYTPENLMQNRNVFDGRWFRTSAYFPGAVEPPSDPKEVHTVRINASQPTAWGSPVSGRENAVRRPTGCYLAPGSVAEVAVPESMVGKGYSIRVGAHSWDLKKKPAIKRLDRVSLVYPITDTRVLIANPLGGGIYIEVPYETDAGIVKIYLRNCVRSPFYSARSFDQTSPRDWQQIESQHPAPWADFETDKFMMQVPSAWLDQVDDPAALMRDWDQSMDAVSELFGYPLVRSKTVLYLQVDVNMRGSAYFPGYPQSNSPYDPHNPERCRQKWLIAGPQFARSHVFHEVGHSQFCSKFRGEVEALVNLPHVAVMNRKFGWNLDKAFGDSMGGMKHLTMETVAAMWMVTENFRNGKEMNYTNRPGDEMKYQHRGYAKYVEIANLFGWDALARFWRTDHENWKVGDKAPQNKDPTDDRILRLSKAAGADLTPLIHFWGIQPEDPKALAKAIRREGLKPSPEIRDRLRHYAASIPMDNAAFREHAAEVYPNGLKNPKNPLFGTGWYQDWLPKYTQAHGEQAQAALQAILDRYFP